MSDGALAQSRRLRLLVLADGQSIHTEKWIRGLADSGAVELTLVTMNPAGVRPGLRTVPALVGIEELYAGPVREGGGNWRYLFNLQKVRCAVRRVKPDAIVAIYLSSYGLMGALAKGDAALAHVMIGSDVMVAPAQQWIYKILSRYALGRGDLLVSSSKVMTARIDALVRVPADAVLTQQYGLEDWVIEHPRLPKIYDFVSNRAWVGNSNIPRLLRIFRRLREPKAMALVGGGTSDAEISRLVAEDTRVIALGLLGHRQNIDVVARSEFYFSMTASDGASLSLMEAMALGAIPVVSDIEPNREWVEPGVNGILVPLDNEAGALALIEALLAEPPGKLDAMRERNRAIIKERGSLTRNMARFRGRLDGLLALRRGNQS